MARTLLAVTAVTPSLAAARRQLRRLLRVGPGQRYEKPCQAIAAARPGDRIEIDARGNRFYRENDISTGSTAFVSQRTARTLPQLRHGQSKIHRRRRVRKLTTV